MASGGQDEVEKAALDKGLREMMRAAADLPVPEHLLALIDQLEAQSAAEDADRKSP